MSDFLYKLFASNQENISKALIDYNSCSRSRDKFDPFSLLVQALKVMSPMDSIRLSARGILLEGGESEFILNICSQSYIISEENIEDICVSCSRSYGKNSESELDFQLEFLSEFFSQCEIGHPNILDLEVENKIENKIMMLRDDKERLGCKVRDLESIIEKNGYQFSEMQRVINKKRKCLLFTSVLLIILAVTSIMQWY